MPKEARYGLIRILGKGGVFLPLDSVEKAAVDAMSVGKPTAAQSLAKQREKEDLKTLLSRKGVRMRAENWG